MGYNMSKPESDPSMFDIGSIDDDPSYRKRHSDCSVVNHEIFNLSPFRSEPSVSTLRGLDGGRRMPISTVKMLFGRESNCSGREKFSSADRSHVLGRYLHVNGPWTEWIPGYKCLSSPPMAHFLLQGFRVATSEYTMLIMGGKYERTFLLEACGGL